SSIVVREFWSGTTDKTHRALRRVGYLRTSELQEATHVLLRSAQRECVGEEFKDLQRSGEVKRSSGLKTLSPIIHDGVMRIDGRLRNAPVSYDRKHPIILATSHPLTFLIVQLYHRNLHHAGQQLMISTIREELWQLRIRNLNWRPKNWSSPVKSYAAIFFCKAMHIELIDNLSTPSFIATLKRFVAPVVKSLKRHLKATIENVVLQRDDLEILLVQVEACLNSRPLTQLTVDAEDLEILTPGHFLVHRALSSLPEPSYDGIPENRLDRYQQTQEYVRHIWKRWNKEYLSGLHRRTKWTGKRDNLREGTMVLLKEDNLPLLKWRYDRVIRVYPGDAGLIRVVNVKTRDG
uniref:DUF5641 domain-containing protein n=1 Tax=Anopheles funestus TaxID=62324 RepID=A0A182S0F5_ANOFN